MTATRATVRLFVAVTGLVASLFELAGALVRLVTACTEILSRRLRSPRRDATLALALAPTVIAPAPAPRVAPTVLMSADERLTSALLSLKFPAAKVRAYAASVQHRQAPLEVLVKEGIVALTTTAN
jgi:hypothetical protein